MKSVLFAAILLTGLFTWSVEANERSPETRTMRIYEFDFEFFNLMAKKYQERHGRTRPSRINPRVMILESVGDIPKGDYFVYSQYLGRHFFYYKAPTYSHLTLERVYKELMQMSLVVISKQDLKEIIEEDKKRRPKQEKFWPDLKDIPEWHDPAENAKPTE